MSAATPTLQGTLLNNHNLPLHEFLDLLSLSGNPKDHSLETHTLIHLPLLSSSPNLPITLLLLGTSMLERLRTTGASTTIGSLDFPISFNAGVSGDRIKNVIYRLGKLDLFSRLQHRQIRFIFLQIGTNDITRTRPLQHSKIALYALILEALTRMAPSAEILVGGIMPRRDVNCGIVEESNVRLETLVTEYGRINTRSFGPDGGAAEPITHIHYIPPNPAIGLEHLDDHIHLNTEGIGYTQREW